MFAVVCRWSFDGVFIGLLAGVCFGVLTNIAQQHRTNTIATNQQSNTMKTRAGTGVRLGTKHAFVPGNDQHTTKITQHHQTKVESNNNNPSTPTEKLSTTQVSISKTPG